jgi:SH3 domain-containing YSC84-like protein 1
VAGTDWKLNTEILSYSRTKGIFGGLTLEGAVVEQDNDSTWAIYDHEPKFRAVLSGGIPTPGPAEVFVNEVSGAAARAHEENR